MKVVFFLFSIYIACGQAQTFLPWADSTACTSTDNNRYEAKTGVWAVGCNSYVEGAGNPNNMHDVTTVYCSSGTTSTWDYPLKYSNLTEYGAEGDLSLIHI